MATVTPNYTASAAITITSLASLASSGTFVAGAESAVIDNRTNKYDDALVSGRVRVGTTPTINTQILIYVFCPIDTVTPTYPDVMDGTDSVETLASVGVGRGFLKLGATLDVDAVTSAVDYPFTFSVADLYRGVMPSRWSLFITHNCVAALNATQPGISFEGIKYDVA